MSKSLSFSLKLGVISGVIWILVSLSTRSGPITVYAMGATAIIGTVLIWKRKTTDFKSRFLMGFGSAWTALLVFAGYIVYMRGASAPVWAHLLNIPITAVLAMIVAAVIAAIARPWQTDRMTA